MKSCTLTSALECSKYGKIEEWIHFFLQSDGNNVELSKGLKLQERFWIGPVLMDLKNLERVCGPEKYMEFVEDENIWEYIIGNMQKSIHKGWDIPPLIAENRLGKLSLRDGSHRFEAMVREGITKYWIIILDNEKQSNLLQFK